jgi:predicted nuclease of predicted toxin-antitoxin system
MLVCTTLREQGHDVEWVPETFQGDPGDEAIIDKSLSDGSILITGDKDFGEWIFLRGKSQPPLIRISAMCPGKQKEVINIILEEHSDDLMQGALITANTERIRIRRNRLGRET